MTDKIEIDGEKLAFNCTSGFKKHTLIYNSSEWVVYRQRYDNNRVSIAHWHDLDEDTAVHYWAFTHPFGSDRDRSTKCSSCQQPIPDDIIFIAKMAK
jgi:hypothetical protein